MANPNNLIRPPVLNTQAQIGTSTTNSIPPLPTNLSSELEAQIVNLVRRAYADEERNRQQEQIFTDQGIDEQHRDLTD